MTVRRLNLSALALLIALASASSVRADWPVCTDLSQLMDSAKKKGMPICVLYLMKVPAGSGWNTRLGMYETFPQYQDLMAVRIYQQNDDDAFWKIRSGIDINLWCGTILIDGGGRVLGVQTDDMNVDPRQMADQVNNAWQVTRWEKTTDGQLKTVDSKIKQRQYAELYAMINTIDGTDKKISAKLKDSVPWLPSRAGGRIHIIEGPPGASGSIVTQGKPAAKQTEDGQKKADTAARNNQWFYYDEVTEARTKLRAALQTEFDAATELLYAAKVQEAQTALKRLIFFKVENDDLAKKITDLKTQVDVAVRTGKVPARPAGDATSASSASSAAPVAAK